MATGLIALLDDIAADAAKAAAVTWLTQAGLSGVLVVVVGALADAFWKLVPRRARA